jgi:pimeloyl-ACP methyl ester carboxylesterase
VSADPHLESNGGPAGDFAEAIYLDSGGQRLFAWLRSPRGGAVSSLGIVICKPFGYEAVCAHRSLRAFSEAAVAIGVPTLRVDYLGTGDSAEIDSQANQLEVWTRDVVAAVAELRRRTGVQHICLLGVRLGALLALMAAEQCPEVTSLMLISPIINGRRYLRELRTTRMAAALRIAERFGEPVVADNPDEDAGSVEVSGYGFSAATLASLALIDLTSATAPDVRNILVIDGKSLPTSNGWAKQLTGAGISTCYMALPGLIEMTMTAPQHATIPHDMIQAVRAWLVEFLASPAVRQSGTMTVDGGKPAIAPSSGASVLTLNMEVLGQATTLTERPVFFGVEAPLFGIVTEPRRNEIRRRAVIMLNAGADFHVGVNAINVTLAREWASRGYVVLRMDLAGLGDSGTRSGQPDNEVFPPAALDDIRAAIDLVRSRYGARELTLFGLCSGAYHALRAAAAGLEINRILMVNPQNYFWKQGMSLEGLQLYEVAHNPGLYSGRIFSMAAWKRLLAGKANIRRIAMIYLYSPLLTLESTLRSIARRLRVRLPNDLGWELEEIIARGIKIVFIFARGEPGIDLLKIQAGSSVKRLGERCRMHIIEGADHVFSQRVPREKLKKILSDELFTSP